MYDKSEENSNLFQRSSANEVKKCEELQRKIRFFESEISKTAGFSSTIPEPSDDTLYEYETTLDDLDEKLSAHEAELSELNKRLDLLLKQKNSKLELKQVLLQGEQFFKAESGDLIGGNSGVFASRSEDTDPTSNGGLRFVTGVIRRDKVQSFMMLCYRATRGLMIPRFVEIKEPMYDSSTQTLVDKNVFIIFFNAETIGLKVAKICESIGANIHEIPTDSSLEESKNQLETEIEDHSYTIDQSLRRRIDLLNEISISLGLWKKYVEKEKKIFHTMNMFKFMARSAYAQAWIPAKYERKLQEILDHASTQARTDIPSSFEVVKWKDNQTPPTYFEESEFVQSFQMIIDAYGVPAYKEANPAVLSTILFPFIFAIMFGDYGHGFIMFLFAITICILQSKLRKLAESNEIFGMIFSGRYIILLMSIFSIYTGLIYNDIFALSLENFGQSAFSFDPVTLIGTKVRRTYVFGVDPAWFGTSNKLAYYNSLKMKMSIIFGVLHMMVGLFLGLSNHIHHREWTHIFFEFIPEVLILGCTFGYMGVMIIIKWCTDWISENRQPPSILNTMTDFFLHPWGIQQPPLYSGQMIVQLTLLLIAGVSIPIMLFPLPILKIIKRLKTSKKSHEQPLNAYEDDQAYKTELSNAGQQPAPVVNPDAAEEEEEESTSEIFIKQLIHTIEYVLGAVSNTASYLRLWALSLAHSQLSEVFWEMTMGLVLQQDTNTILGKILLQSGLGFLIAYPVWFMATIAILLGMESLSAFLHTLRLIWVEHNNKYFAGTGIPFEPFSLKKKQEEEA